MGDHGIAELHTELRPNVWLREAGLRDEHLAGGRWRATFHGDGGAMFLRLRDPRDRQAADRALDRLAGLGRASEPLFRILEREELDALGAAPEAVLALAAVPGFVFSERAAGPAAMATIGGGHGYHSDEPEMITGLVGAGAGLRRDASVPVLPLQNVAPLAAALLGIDLPAADGALLPGLLTG